MKFNDVLYLYEDSGIKISPLAVKRNLSSSCSELESWSLAYLYLNVTGVPSQSNFSQASDMCLTHFTGGQLSKNQVVISCLYHPETITMSRHITWVTTVKYVRQWMDL